MPTREARSPTWRIRSLALTVALLAPSGAAEATPACAPPGPSATVDAALRHAGLDRPIEARIRRRARLAHILPNSVRLEARSSDADIVRAESRLDQEIDAVIDTETADLTDWLRAGVDVRRDARAIVVWDLSALVWTPADLHIERLAREIRSERNALAERVLDVYFRWRTARDATGRPEAARSTTHEVARDEALLDYLTGGWFGATAHCTGPSPYLP